MIIHALNPLIEIKCPLSTTIGQVIQCIKQHILKETKGSIEMFIGQGNEIKVAPEMELIGGRSEYEDDIEWGSESTGVTLTDVLIFMCYYEPLYLYYYWDKVKMIEQTFYEKHHKELQWAKKTLEKFSAEKGCEYIANKAIHLLERTQARERFRARRNKRKVPESPLLKDKLNVKLNGVKIDTSDIIYDLNSPFKNIFSSPKQYLRNSQYKQPLDNLKPLLDKEKKKKEEPRLQLPDELFDI